LDTDLENKLAHSSRDWLVNSVARELSLEGIDAINLEQLAGSAGMSVKQLRELYPDKRALVMAVIKETSQAHKDFAFQDYPEAINPKARLVHFISRSIEFSDAYPNLAQVIVIALLGSDSVVKKSVFQAYNPLFSLILDDLISEGIIPNKSLLLVSDLSDVLLSLIFLGGCPWLQMDYISFVYPEKIAVSALDAMKRRYALDEFKITTS
jgi:AcrR family transcriptional regulator